ncbi:MAG: sigma-54-dependent Fis family transcriptional regulator [Deltaproteobacteria bacterium]|nr:sigma-54-dependent Fis family transcriptional regulator [Deltaproteobacteria bacterium]
MDGLIPLEEGSVEALVREENDWLDVELFALDCDVIGGMVVRSGNMQRVLKTIQRLGPYKTSVLIHGESGTGKELVARALHTLGAVPKGPFVTFNCSNLLESLAESQLFGHVRGAFTDACEDSLGYFRSANGGTLFLDEIGELPLRLQPKLLRAVETHEVQPVGSAHSYKVDIRLIAATNRDLRAMVKAGEFRDDLYYRLNATAILVPPLRERRDAIEALAVHFIEHYNRLFGKQIRYLSRRAIAMLQAYDWPGNVREFAHSIQSAVMLTDGDRIGVETLPDYLLDALLEARATVVESTPDVVDVLRKEVTAVAVESVNPVSLKIPAPLLLDEVIKRTLVRSLEETEGNRRRAAELLGISRSTLYRMLTRYGLSDDGVHRRISGVHSIEAAGRQFRI